MRAPHTSRWLACVGWLSEILCLSSTPALIRGVQHALIVEAIFARRQIRAAAFYCGRKTIEHAAVGVCVGYALMRGDFSLTIQDNINWMVYGQAVFADNDACFSGNLYQAAISSARCDGDRAHRTISKGKSKHCECFHVAGFCVLVCKGADAGDVGREDKAQGIEAVNGDIADGATEGEFGVVYPGTRTTRGFITELRMHQHRCADASFGDPFADELDARVIAHVLRYSEDNPRSAGGEEHLFCLCCVHRQWFFAQDVLAILRGKQNVRKVQSVG